MSNETRLNLRDVIGELAGGQAILRYSRDSNGADLVTPHGFVTAEDLGQWLNQGWLYSTNGHYRLTDEGLRAYIKSTDEMGDGKLVAPVDRMNAKSGGGAQ